MLFSTFPGKLENHAHSAMDGYVFGFVLFLSRQCAPKIVKEVFAKIQEINDKRNIAVIVVEHNIKSLVDITSRAYVLDKGKVAFHGTSEEISKGNILEKVFLGGL